MSPLEQVEKATFALLYCACIFHFSFILFSHNILQVVGDGHMHYYWKVLNAKVGFVFFFTVSLNNLKGIVHFDWYFSHYLLILMTMKVQVKFFSPQNTPGVLQEINIAAFSQTTAVNIEKLLMNNSLKNNINNL